MQPLLTRLPLGSHCSTRLRGVLAIETGENTITCTIQQSPKGEVNSGVYIPRHEALRYISSAMHRP